MIAESGFADDPGRVTMEGGPMHVLIIVLVVLAIIAALIFILGHARRG